MNREIRSPRGGFTLLELFLTLSMAVVLMTLINSAFTFYARDMDRSDADMRQTMLASALMQMIEDDLRASLHPEPLDTAALEELLSKTASSASGMSGGGGGGGAGGGEEMSDEDMSAAGMDDTEAEEETSTTATLDSGSAVLVTPGVIGNQYQIQIDTSRLPRLEEYAVMMDMDPGNMTDVPSDLKTISYFVQPEGSGGVDDPLAQFDATSAGQSGGLVRRSLDRSANAFASLSGGLSSLGETGELLAPEVTGLEFSYWDGVTWQLQWNSDELGELPLAIKIQMAMAGQPNADDTEPQPRIFQHIVRLPLAKYIEEEDEELAGAGI
ncbi:type II secretion system protein GspJ [Stieleria sp. TO1_6]|uniref:type II secretion system protein GspJ n=1 Tax=Stieleria tagensis TaxID=2956795 RepID=UPI00209B77EA|nr:type II secretion system protein GspJ [Stieleria tagensis]MCO8121979.1 type II secretion system protein GspJ [Stieleria tagensis]